MRESASPFWDGGGSDKAELIGDGADAVLALARANSLRESWNFRVAKDDRHA